MAFYKLVTMVKPMRNLRPVNRVKVSDQVVHQIAARVMAGDHGSPGVTTATESLCQQLNVSRTAVREALKVLETKGLVEVLPRGVRPRPRADWDLLDPQVLDWLYDSKPDADLHQALLEFREIIEPGAAELATTRATPDQIELLHECCRRMGAAPEEIKKHVAADVDFHTTLLAACNNEFLTRMSAMIRAALSASISLTAHLPQATGLSVKLHLAVAQAIGKRDPAAARAAMQEVIRRTREDIRQILSDNKASESVTTTSSH